MKGCGGIKGGGRGAAAKGPPRTEVRAKGFEASTSAGEITAKEASLSFIAGGVLRSVKEGAERQESDRLKGEGECILHVTG